MEVEDIVDVPRGNSRRLIVSELCLSQDLISRPYLGGTLTFVVRATLMSNGGSCWSSKRVFNGPTSFNFVLGTTCYRS